MMTLQTNLSRRPYFDDFTPTSTYYRVLIKPKAAIQARELNQMQSILQEQIGRFGRNIFKEGSIVEGCTLSFDNKRPYVKITDNYSNGTAFTISDFEGQYITNDRGLKAIIVDTIEGYVSQAPNTNTLYVKYLNSATYANGSQQTAFDPLDTITIRNSSNVVIGAVGVLSNSVSANVGTPTGFAYAMSTTEGIIFKKGMFLYVTPQTILVERYNNVPDGVSVGFDADESIVTASSDPSLYDNATGYPNALAPGADRLRVIPNLVVRQSTDVANNSSFFSITDFKNGAAVTIKQTQEYSGLGADLARRMYETNGNFVVTPFVLSTQTKTNTSDPKFATHVNLAAGKGLGYVNGYRVEYLNNNVVDLRKGTDYESVANQIVTANFGSYVLVDELSGEFSSTGIVQVELHNIPKTSITSGTLLSTGYSSTTKIGTAYVRGFMYDNGQQGTAGAQYALYLFNITMNPGQNFANVKSVINYNSTLQGVADVVLSYNATLNANVAQLQQTYNNGLVFPFGQSAIKSDGFAETQYIYRKKSTVQMLTTGNTTINLSAAIGSGRESFPYSGTLSSSQVEDMVVVAVTRGTTSNLAGTVATSSTNNVVLGTGTSLLSSFAPGDYIRVNSEDRVVVSIANNTMLVVGSPFSTSNTGTTYAKSYPAGAVIPLSNRPTRTVTVSNTSATITTNESFTSPFNVDVFYSVARANTVPVSKVLNTGTYTKINCSNNAGGALGPWSIGVPDVIGIDAVYIGNSNNYAANGTNYAQYFVLDNGQRDSYYDLASISLSTTAPRGLVSDTSTLLVKFSHFTTDQSQGIGFFTANSYPIDDANTANTTAITTQEIPLYTSPKGSVFDLRDSVDFRVYAANTASISNTVVGATVNPATTVTFSNTYLPTPDSMFITDLEYYLRRIDRVALDTGGNIVVTEGIPSATNPQAPKEKSGTMTLGYVTVPPYPSLTTSDARAASRYDYAITATLDQNQRFTMKDIGLLKKRVENIEYYTSLSLLEQSAATMTVRSDSTGQNRFRNGIFVDPFKGFDLSNTLDPQYYIAIDSNRSELRPAFARPRSNFFFDPVNSVGVQKHGELVMLNHTSNNVYSTQKYASKYRNCISGNVFEWTGTITLTPSGTISPDTTTAPDVVSNLDLASNWVNLANAWGTQWGNWVDQSTSTGQTLAQLSSSSTTTNADGSKTTVTQTQTTSATSTTQTQVGTTLSATPDSSSINLGTYVTNISILPYLKAATIKFVAHGMKPNTRLYAYFSNVPVSAYCAPTNSDYSYTGVQGTANSGVMGDPLVSDDSGTVYGYFYLPANTFKAEENDFILNDVSDLTQGSDSIQTTATATFYGSKLSFATGSSILSTRTAIVTSNEVSQTRTIQGIATSNTITTTITPPPPATPQHDDCGCGKIICTKLYELGLMPADIFKADQDFGKFIAEADPAVYNGYIRWARTVVDWMGGETPDVMFWIRDPEARRQREHEITMQITFNIATPWSEHMAYLMGAREKDNRAGRLIMAIGKPISRLVSKLPGGNGKPGYFGKMAMLAAFFTAYGISKLFGGIDPTKE